MNDENIIDVDSEDIDKEKPNLELSRRQKEIEEDYDLARDTYVEILKTGKEAIPILSKLCDDSQHPRAFEVLSKMMKDTADIADKLLEGQRRKQVVDTESAMEMIRAQEEMNHQSTNLLPNYSPSEEKFQGTTEQMHDKLQERIEAAKENEES